MSPLALFPLLLLLALFGCGSPPPERSAGADQPAAAAPPRQVSGREAFQNMLIAARSWALDARPFRLTNFYMKDSTGVGGRAVAWTAGFVSPSLRKARTYTYSTIKTENLHQGVFAGHDESFRSESELTGPPFEVLALRVDSDKAFESAEAKGGKRFRQKNPQLPITYLLEHDRSSGELVWRVCYDTQCTTARFAVTVDASTGAVLKVSR